MFKKISLIASAAIMVWIGHGDSQAADEKILVYALKDNVVSLDYAQAYDAIKSNVVSQIMEGLLEYNEKAEVVPLLAENWVRVNPTTFTFRLRKGIKFHNGEKLTADDVVYSLERIRDPKVNSRMKWMYDNVDKIEKISDDLIRITLYRPDATFKYILATSAGYITNKEYTLEQGENFWKHPIGTGPFKLQKWTEGKEVVLMKNKDYWQEGLPYLDKVIFRIIPKTEDRIKGLYNGDVDMTASVPVSSVENMPNINLSEITVYGIVYIIFNTRRAPFNDKRVRQAINFAIDKNRIFAANGYQLATSTSVPPNMWGSAYSTVKKYSYSIDSALELLSNTPYKNGFKCNLLTTSAEPFLQASEAIKKDLKRIGIDLAIKVVSYDQRLTLRKAGDFDMIFSDWLSDVPDPDGMLYPIFHSKNVNNWSRYKNNIVDRKLEKARLIYDHKRRVELYREIQELIAEDAPCIWLYYPSYTMALNRKFIGYRPSPIYIFQHFLKTVKIKEE